MKLVYATENAGKIREMKRFAAHYDVEIFRPSEAGFTPQDVEETGDDYDVNARLKVDAYTSQPQAKDWIICADDTGVEIDALGGEPGVRTRRWLGHRMSDDEIIGYTFGRLHGVKDKDRTAHFKITVAYSMYGGEVELCKGQLDGRIVSEPMRDAPPQDGLPYRKLFMVTGEKEVPLWKFDQTPPHDRVLSHRESAFKKLFEIMKAQEK